MKTNTRIDFFAGYLALAAALACVLCGTLATKANAEPPPNPLMTETYNFSGFYGGFNIGGVLSQYDFEVRESFVDVEQQFFGGPSFSSDAGVVHSTPDHADYDGEVIGGGQTGYNAQFGHVLIGFEGDFQRTATSASQQSRHFGVPEEPIDFFDSDAGQTVFAVNDFTSTRRAQTDWMASARLRLGWVQGRFLFYATGGPTWANVDLQRFDTASTNFFGPTPTPTATPVPRPGVSFTPPPGPPGTEFLFNQTNSIKNSDDDVRFGWTAGGGVEIAFSEQVSFGLEYRHSDYGNQNSHFSDGGGPIFSQGHEVQYTNDQVTLKFNILMSHFFGH